MLILLRLMIIRYPLSRKGPMRFRKTLLLATWIIPFITKAPFIYLWQYPYFHFLYQNFQFHIFSALPLANPNLLIINSCELCRKIEFAIN